MFKLVKKDKNSRARTGVIETAHGIIETPAYAMVGTHGSIKCLPPEKLPETKTQLVIANTFHLWQDFEKTGKTSLAELPPVHRLFGQKMPVMTDSGGFQVFSLGFAREHGIGKIAGFFPEKNGLDKYSKPERNLVTIRPEGVYFKISSDRPEEFLGPESSIRIQEALGADIIFSFDECTSPLHDYKYTKEAMERTHSWAKTCLEAKTRKDQLLYGIVQGGEFEDLRTASAKFIGSLPFDGFVIGGSLGKSRSSAFDVLKWSIPLLTESHPRHFLGIGNPADIFEGVELGIDTFDCVVPTREARHGAVWTKEGRIDVRKGMYQSDMRKLDENCGCPVCQTLPRAELNRQFRAGDQMAGQNATVHNIFFFNNLMSQIREAIKEGRFQQLKSEFLSRLNKN